MRITTDLRLSIEAVAAMKKIMDEFASDPSCGEPFQRLVNEAKDKLTSSYQTQTAGSTGKGGEPGVDSGDPGNVGGAPPRAEKPKPKSEVPGGKTGGTEETP